MVVGFFLVGAAATRHYSSDNFLDQTSLFLITVLIIQFELRSLSIVSILVSVAGLSVLSEVLVHAFHYGRLFPVVSDGDHIVDILVLQLRRLLFNLINALVQVLLPIIINLVGSLQSVVVNDVHLVLLGYQIFKVISIPKLPIDVIFIVLFIGSLRVHE